MIKKDNTNCMNYHIGESKIPSRGERFQCEQKKSQLLFYF